MRVWARVHKIDRVRPQADGSAIVLVEDERTAGAMGMIPSLSTLIAASRVIAARRALESKFGGKGEVRYAAAAMPPPFLVDAILRAGGAVADSRGEKIVVPATGAGALSAIADDAFAQLAHATRTTLGASTIAVALTQLETRYRAKHLDRDKEPAAYWRAVFEIAALAGELSRARGGRWVDTTELPVPFVLKFADGTVARPAKQAMDIVDGVDVPPPTT